MPKPEKTPAVLGGRHNNRIITSVEPKTQELRTRAEQLALAEVISRIPFYFAWMDSKMLFGTEMSDKPMADLIAKMLDKAMPERRQVEAAQTGQIGRGGAMIVHVSVDNGVVRRGTKAARERAIELRKQGNGYVAEAQP